MIRKQEEEQDCRSRHTAPSVQTQRMQKGGVWPQSVMKCFCSAPQFWRHYFGPVMTVSVVCCCQNGGPVNGGANNWPLRGAKTTFWEGGTRGAAFVWSKNLLTKTGYVNNEYVHNSTAPSTKCAILFSSSLVMIPPINSHLIGLFSLYIIPRIFTHGLKKWGETESSWRYPLLIS